MKKNKNIPVGYKDSSVGVIPKEWEVESIENFSPLQRGFDLPINNIIEGEYPVVFSNGILKFHKEAKVKGPGVVTGRSGTIGKVTFVEKDFWPHNTSLWVTDFKSNNPKYVYYLINYIDLTRFMSGSGVPTLNRNDVHKFKIGVAPLPEQKKIAEILSTWDDAIEKQSKLVGKLKLRKQALMQQLLTGKKRLKGFDNTKWKLQSLNNFIKPISRQVPKPDKPYIGLGIRSHGKGTFLKYDKQPESNSMDVFYTVRPYDLIVNITFAWEQAIAIAKPEDDGALASHRFPTFTFIKDKGNPNYFKFFILLPLMKYKLDLISPGGAGRNRVMNKSDFIKLEFRIPDYQEQTAIANILSTADKEIEIANTKLDKLQKQKKGLMQQLLTGKKRVKLN